MRPCIETASGLFFHFIDPDPETVIIDDIAHALSNICRYTGHARHFYSVAQHSVLCSLIVPPAQRFAALMHDAAEAYIGDVSSPLKSLLPEYSAIEARIEAVVLGKFGIDPALSREVKHADYVMLNTERLPLLTSHDAEPWEWVAKYPTYGGLIGFWPPEKAKDLFLRRFFELDGVA